MNALNKELFFIQRSILRWHYFCHNSAVCNITRCCAHTRVKWSGQFLHHIGKHPGLFSL